MTRDMLYDAAFRYKKAGLWKKLWDNDVFAIKLNSGEMGYISVMGKNGEYCALGLYIGEEGFQTYRIMANAGGYSGNEFKDRETLLQQNCLQMALENKDMLMPEEVDEARAYAKEHGIKFTGKNAYPQFIKYEPNYHPWKVKTEEDMQALYDALEAAILMADLLKTVDPEDMGIINIEPNTAEVPLFEVKGNKLLQIGMAPLPREREDTFEIVKISNDILVAQVKNLPKKGIWEAEMVRMFEPVQNNLEDTPYYPLLLLIVEHRSYYILPVPMIMDVEHNPQELIQAYVEAWKMQGSYPKEIRCRDGRTYAMLKDFSDKTGVKIGIYHGELPALDDAEYELLNHMMGDEDEVADQMMEAVEAILEMSPAELRTMPPQLMEQLMFMIENEVFPEDIAKELAKKLSEL